MMFFFSFGLAALLVSTYAEDLPEPRRKAGERLNMERLAAAHADAARLNESRRSLRPFELSGVRMNDYRSILHAHAEDAAHTGGTRPEMLADAKRADVSVIMLTDHFRPPRDFMDSFGAGCGKASCSFRVRSPTGFSCTPKRPCSSKWPARRKS